MASSEVEAEEAQADFLFLRQLGQGASSVRIGDPLSIENSESSVNLLSISNSNGLLFAATKEGFIAHPLQKIRGLCSSSTRKESPRLEQPLRAIKTMEAASLGSSVAFLRLADDEKKVLAGLTNGRIAIWSVADLIERNADPAVIMQPPSADLTLLEVAPNPSERPELCIALYGTADKQKLRSGTAVAFNVRTGQWGSELRPASAASTTSLCWSVKGKQIVLGLDNGHLAQMTPEGEEKDAVPSPQGLSGTPYVEQVVWLENHVFFVTYNQPPSSEDPEHQCEVYTILRQAATKTFSYVHFADPAPPFGDTSRREHRFISWLKGWEPNKHMIFVASTSSTDVGLLGSSSSKTGSDAWQNLDLEDTSRPVLPFSSIDKDADTSPVALEVDFTAESNVDDPQAANRGEDGTGKLPPMPVLYIYTNDGLLLAYTIVNTASAAGKYPGMITIASAPKAGASSEETIMATDAAEEEQESSSMSNSFSVSTPAATKSASASGSGFGHSSAFGQKPGLDGLKTDTMPAFGQSASIGSKSSSPFSFNPAASTPSASSGSAPTGGFGAFASKPQSAFGSASTSFSFGTPSASAETTSPASAFGNTLVNNSFSAPAFGATSKPAFGSPSAAPAFGSSSAFGSTASAFGQPSAFGSSAVKSPFASASTGSAFAPAQSSSTTSGFGGFASKSSTFGASPANDGNSAASIFGSGGSLQTPSAAKDKPVFGQSLSSSTAAKSGPVSLFASNATPVDNEAGKMEEEGASGSGSLSFGGFGGLLGDGKSSTGSETKSTGFTFGSKQDATHSTTTTPTPFSFTKPQEPQVEHSASKVGATETTLQSAFPLSTTPTASPVKTKGDEEARKVSNALDDDDGGRGDDDGEVENDSGQEFLPADRSTIQDEVNEDTEKDEEADEDDDDDDYEDEEDEERSEIEEEQQEADEDEHDDEVDGAEESEGEEKFEKSVDYVSATAKTTPLVGEKAELPDQKANAKSEVPIDRRDGTKDISKDAEEGAAVKKELKSPTSFSFLPTNTPPPATSEPPSFSLAASKTTGASAFASAVPSPSFSPPTQTPSKDPSVAATGSAKNQGFLNFNSRAPRSSSPLSGLPVNRKDLPPSPVKAPTEVKPSAPFSFSSQKGAPVDFGSKEVPTSKPSLGTFAPKQQPTTESKPFSFGSPTPFQQAQSVPPVTATLPPASTEGGSAQVTKAMESPSTQPWGGRTRTREATPRLTLPDGKVSMEGGQEQGLQALFLQTFLTMEKELHILKENMQLCNEHQAMLKVQSEKPLGVYDLSDESVWTFGELDTKSRLAHDLNAEAERLAQDTQALKISLKEMQSQQIKVDVKREEIAKFLRARNDPSFSKLVRVKQLGPEHAENQSKLRRATSAVRDGIEELEAYLKKARKIRIEEKNGRRAALQAPSLDTIRRTARNITQSAQIRLIELQELEMGLEHLTAKGPSFSRSVDSSSMMADLSMTNGADGDVLTSMNTLKSALPVPGGGRHASGGSAAVRHDMSTGNVSGMQSKMLDLKSVFLSGWKEPVLNAPSKMQGQTAAAVRDFQMSDLDMAFAKGPIRVSAPAKAAVEPALPPPAAKPAASAAPSFFAASDTAPPKSSTNAPQPPPFTFSPLPSTALPKDAFQLPPEDTPFSPGGASFGAASGRGHHVSKFGGKRNTAVALPPASSALNGSPSFSFAPASSAAPMGNADFFATPPAQQDEGSISQVRSAFGIAKPTTMSNAPSTFSFGPNKQNSPSFPSLGSAGLSSFSSSGPKAGTTTTTTTPSLASRFAPVTFEGLQPMKPIAAASIDNGDVDEEEKEDDSKGGGGIDDNESEYEDEEGDLDDDEEDEAEEEEADGHDYVPEEEEDDEDAYEDEEEEEGLSDVVEGEEEG